MHGNSAGPETMILSLLICLLVFGGITLGLAWPAASRLALDPAEKLVATIALSLLGVYLFAWMIYVWALPLWLLWALPALSIAGLLTHWRALHGTLVDPNAASLGLAQVLITLWSIAWLAVVVSYSGGDWLADWFGHLQRTWFFLDRGPRDILFNGFDALTSRPPMANVINGAFLEVTRRNFAHYQFVSTLLGSLAFLPTGLLARRWGGGRAITILTVLFMVSPLFVENATYAWTKLPAAFFTLAAIHFFLRAHDDGSSPVHGMIFAVTLACGIITHYSTGPYALYLGMGWMLLGWPKRRDPAWWRSTFYSAGAGALVLGTWFGWTFAVYGLRGSLLTNSSVTDSAPGALNQLRVVFLNLRDTLIPHFLRDADFSFFAQANPLGWWRDWFFALYQTNLFLAFGSVAWMAILFLLLRRWGASSRVRRLFWSAFIVGNVVVGVAVHGGRGVWGLTHICLQPLILLGLAFLAAYWRSLPRRWRLALVAGATVDFALGIFLQFSSQAYAIHRYLQPNRTIAEIVPNYSLPTRMNFSAKDHNHWVFVGDLFHDYWAQLVAMLIILFLIALVRVKKAGTEPTLH